MTFPGVKCSHCGLVNCNTYHTAKSDPFATTTPEDAVNHPPHYKAGGLEVIDVIEAFGLGFRLGNAVKYLLRAGRKGDAVEDLKKSIWYIQREIERREFPR